MEPLMAKFSVYHRDYFCRLIIVFIDPEWIDVASRVRPICHNNGLGRTEKTRPYLATP